MDIDPIKDYSFAEVLSVISTAQNVFNNDFQDKNHDPVLHIGSMYITNYGQDEVRFIVTDKFKSTFNIALRPRIFCGVHPYDPILYIIEHIKYWYKHRWEDLKNIPAEQMQEINDKLLRQEEHALERLRFETVKFEWPKEVIVHLHADEDRVISKGEKLGLTEEAIIENFRGALYEVAVTLSVNQDGTYKIKGFKE